MGLEGVVKALATSDAAIAVALNALVRRSAVARGWTIGWAIGLAPVEVVLMAWLGVAGGRRSAGTMLAGVGLAYLASEMLGRLWQRQRPFVARSEVEALVPHSARRSFPSRHVASALAMAAIGHAGHPGLGMAMSTVGWLLGLSRVAAGLHYPSDVLAGALLGSLIGRLLRQ